MKKLGIVATVIVALSLLGGCWILGPTGIVEGTVVDATTGNGLEGVNVTVDGAMFSSTSTDADGEFSIIVPAGDQVLDFSLSGYDFDSVEVSVSEGLTEVLSTGTIMASPEIDGDGIRFVLTWGETPYDLDSHLLTPGGFHIYYANSSPTGAGAYLDVDDTSSFGPETITILTQEVGTYEYYVYNFSGSPEITTSDAFVRIYDATGLVEALTIPTSGTGAYWHVATLSGSTLTLVNEIRTTAP